MKWLTIQLMKYNLMVAIRKQAKVDNLIVKSAYNNLIKNYKDTIMFLEVSKLR